MDKAEVHHDGICPICRNEHVDLFPFHCCTRCHDYLVSGRDTQNKNFFQPPENKPVRSIIPSKSRDLLEDALTQSEQKPKSLKDIKKHKEIQQYYSTMSEWLNQIDELDEIPDYSTEKFDANEANFAIRCSTYCSFGLNMMLLTGKAIAMSTSSSYTIMSSLADSCLDIIAGIIISYTAATSQTTEEDKLKYPAGKSRISTVGILVFSVLMSVCALYIIGQCMMALINHEIAPQTTKTAVCIMLFTITVKFFMWIIFKWLGHPITLTLAEDHRNDVITNSFGLFMYWGGAKLRWWMDSVGGIVISLFILQSWAHNAAEMARMLMGEIASPDIVRNVTYVAAHHHPLIKTVDKVVAYQIGPGCFAEVYVTIPDHVGMKVGRWIGDSLQKRLERIPEIEHAFIHVDSDQPFSSEDEKVIRKKSVATEDGLFPIIVDNPSDLV